MEEIEIKYINGLPTKSSINALMVSFDERLTRHIMFSHTYGKKNSGNGTLTWQDYYVQNRIDAFIQYLVDKGVPVGKYRPHSLNVVGRLEIKKQKI